MYRSIIFVAISTILIVSVVWADLNGWEEQSAGKPWSIQIVSDNVRKGRAAIRFEVRQGDERISPRSGMTSYRSELNERPIFTAAMGKDYWYGFSMYIPEDFPETNSRLNIGQWHASYDEELGEIKRSPILSQKYKRGKFYVNVRYSSQEIQKSNDGIKKLILETRNMQKGVWHDFIYHVKWSYRDDGYVDMWLDGNKLIEYKGPVGYNDKDGPYFKYGIYRDDVPEAYVIYFDEYRRGNSYEDVDPSRNGAVD